MNKGTRRWKGFDPGRLAVRFGVARQQSATGWWWVSLSLVALELGGLVGGLVLERIDWAWAHGGETGLLILSGITGVYTLGILMSVLFDRPRRRRSLSANTLARWPGAIVFMAGAAAFSVSQSPGAASLFQGGNFVLRGLILLLACCGVGAFFLCIFFPWRLVRGCRIVRNGRTSKFRREA